MLIDALLQRWCGGVSSTFTTSALGIVTRW